MAELFLPERHDEALFKYMLIIPVAYGHDLHITIKRRFGLLSRYTYPMMIKDIQEVTSKHSVIFATVEKMKTFDNGIDYLEIKNQQLATLHKDFLKVFKGKIVTRDAQFEDDNAIFHISVETQEKKESAQGINEIELRTVVLQTGARGEDSKWAVRFDLSNRLTC